MEDTVLTSSYNRIKLDLIASDTSAKTHPLDLKFFTKSTKRSTRLVNNKGDDNFVRIKNGNWLDFEFTELAYVTKVYVFAESSTAETNATISFQPAFGQKSSKVLNSTFNGEAFVFSPNSFIGGFGISIDEQTLDDLVLKKVVVEGFEESRINQVGALTDDINAEINATVDFLNSYIKEAQSASQVATEKKQEIASLEQQIKELRSSEAIVTRDLESLKAQSVTAYSELEKYHSQIENQNARLSAIRGETNQLDNQYKALSEAIVSKTNELHSVQHELDKFPAVFDGYSEQGARNATTYAKLAAIPLLLVVVVTLVLFSNASQLLSIDPDHYPHITEFLIARIPYVTVSLTVLWISYRVLEHLINEIIAINRRKQDLLKISIIANDVSSASLADTDFTEQERFEIRTYLKMELLNAHLKQNIGADFEHRPKVKLRQKFSDIIKAAREIVSA